MKGREKERREKREREREKREKEKRESAKCKKKPQRLPSSTKKSIALSAFSLLGETTQSLSSRSLFAQVGSSRVCSFSIVEQGRRKQPKRAARANLEKKKKRCSDRFERQRVRRPLLRPLRPRPRPPQNLSAPSSSEAAPAGSPLRSRSPRPPGRGPGRSICSKRGPCTRLPTGPTRGGRELFLKDFFPLLFSLPFCFLFSPSLPPPTHQITQLRHGRGRRARPRPPGRLRRRRQEGRGLPQADRDGRLPRRRDACSSFNFNSFFFFRHRHRTSASQDDHGPGLRRRRRRRRPDGERSTVHGRPSAPGLVAGGAR